VVSGVYQSFCGNLISNAMVLWESQAVVATVVTLAFVAGILAENGIGKRKKGEAYNSLLSSSINEDED